VVVFHAVLIYALLNGLGSHIVAVFKQVPIDVAIIEEVKPPPPPPPPPPPTKVVQAPPKSLAPPPPPYVPPPEVHVQTTNAPTISAVTNVKPATTELPTSTAPAVVGGKAVASVSTGPVTDFTSCDSPEYPLNSKRNEEQGTVRLAFLIGVDGRVVEAKVDKSSHYPALDRAAKNALSLCHFKPGTLDGRPVQSWTAVDYVWKLTEE